MTMPAFVWKKNSMHWRYLSEHEDLRIRCEYDPFEVPAGRADFPEAPGADGFYVLERTPIYLAGKEETVLRFMIRSQDGPLYEKFRLTWDPNGGPRYTGWLSGGGQLMRPFPTPIYMRVTTQ